MDDIFKTIKLISSYLPNIGSGYASATIQEVLDMNLINSYSEDYNDPYTSSFLHEPVCGWRLPNILGDVMSQEEYLNNIEAKKNKDIKENNSELSNNFVNKKI